MTQPAQITPDLSHPHSRILFWQTYLFGAERTTLHSAAAAMYHSEGEAMALYLSISMWTSGLQVGILRVCKPSAVMVMAKALKDETPEDSVHDQEMGLLRASDESSRHGP